MKNLIKKLKPLEIMLKNAWVGILSYYLKRSLAKTGKPDLNRPLKVLFIRHERIGDTLISFPVVDILKRKYPTWEISWVTAPRSLDLIADDPRFKNVWSYKKNIPEDWTTIRRARKEKFNIAIDLISGDSVSALAITHLAAPKAYKIGMGKCHHHDFYHIDIRHPFGFTNRHILESTLDLVSFLGVDPYDANRFCQPYVNEDRKEDITEILRSFPQMGDGRPLVGVNISSGETARIWDIENYRRIIADLLARYARVNIIIMAAPDDFAIGKKLAESFEGRVHIPPRPMDICSIAELISRLSMLITTDTSLLHIARTYRIPIVGLYRAHKINIWFPYAQLSGMVISDSEEHLFNIKVEQVVNKVIEIGERFQIPGLCHV